MTITKSKFILMPLIVIVFSSCIPGVSWPSETSTSSTDSTVVVYYFHRTVRCQTCLAIEALAREALEACFAEAIEVGRLDWRPTNIEARGNEHFEDDFKLKFSSLVVVAPTQGNGVAWRNLEKVWDLVEYRDEFIDYVCAHVAIALEKKTTPLPENQR